MTPTNPKVDPFFAKAPQWREELLRLRRLLLECGLSEELKWGKPCYTLQGGNVAILQGFKESCALMFFKGALLKDPQGVLEPPGEYSQAARRVVFTSVSAIAALEPLLRDTIREAIEVERAGLQVELKTTDEYPIPEEFQAKLDEDPALQAAFAVLTPGRQRAYLLHFSAPKQSPTRTARVEKAIPAILAGKGLNDR